MFRALLKEKIIRDEEGSGGANLPELLSPAGTPECARAAILNGADAVYLGLKTGSARAGAGNFGFGELSEVARFAHIRGAKVYVALNTLAFGQAELDTYFQNALRAACEGADGIIVQDLGLIALLGEARLKGQLRKDFRISASTQLGICTPAGLRTMKALGVLRVILPRELTLDEIKALTDEAHRLGMETEVFCHGAMCVCYSGSCLLSSFSGGRSGNRGECAQPCRMKYMLTPGARTKACHLSPDDLQSLPVLDRLCAAGVDSLKIEGRLKAPEYAAAVTRAYRTAIDACAAGRFDEYKRTVLPYALTALRTVFTRDGGHTGFLEGAPGRSHITYQTPGRKGLFLGTVQSGPENIPVSAAKAKGLSFFRFVLSMPEPVPGLSVSAGMGVTLRGMGGGELGGGTVNSVLPFQAGALELTVCGSFERAGSDSAPLSSISVYLTEDPDLLREIRSTYRPDAEPVRLPVYLEFDASPGRPARLTASDTAGHSVTVCSAAPVQAGEKAPLSDGSVRKSLEKLGNVPFYAKNINIRLENGPFMPVSAINGLRRDALAALMEKREGPLPAYGAPLPSFPTAGARTGRQTLPLSGFSFWFYRTESFLDLNKWPSDVVPAVCYAPAETFAAEDICAKLSSLRACLEQLHPEVPECGKKLKIIAALPPLSFPEDLKLTARLKDRITVFADGVQLSDPGALSEAAGEYKAGRDGFLLCAAGSMNVSNPESARLAASFGIDVITLSPEPDQASLLEEIRANNIGAAAELTVSGPVTLMRMRRCIVGTGKPGCRICDGADFRLEGQKGSGYDILTLPRNRSGEPGICQNLLLSDCAFCQRGGNNGKAGISAVPAPGTLLEFRIK